MVLFDFFRKKKPEPTPISTCADIEVSLPAKKAELTEHSEKELAVQRVTLQDMKQFTELPFVWNSEIKKVIGPSTQPYAFMDILGSNVHAACLELEDMNKLLVQAQQYTHLIPVTAKIPVDEIAFTPTLKRSYSKIICTPVTFTGRKSKYPVSLIFMTDRIDPDADSTHGELFFTQSGKVGKAEVICWRNHNGYFFYYKTIGGILSLDKIVSTIVKDNRGLPGIIYRPHYG